MSKNDGNNGAKPPTPYQPIPHTMAVTGIQKENTFINTQLPPQQPREWRYDLCYCCQDCSSCLEVWCCFYCQLSRQYNVKCQNGRPEINWLILFAACFGDSFCCGLASPIIQYLVRNKLRGDLGIHGSECGDCCIVYCCPPCGLQQSLMEMTDEGISPGACCYDPTPRAQTMH